jgi:hypothetical protein
MSPTVAVACPRCCETVVLVASKSEHVLCEMCGSEHILVTFRGWCGPCEEKQQITQVV